MASAQDRKRRRDEDDEDSDNESMGSLKDFIAPDDESASEEESGYESDDGAGGAAGGGAGASGPDAKKRRTETEAEAIRLMAEEAAKITGDLSATTVGGRTLRDRSKVKPPVDDYYERFGRKAEMELQEKMDKKDIIEFVKDLESDHRRAYEAEGHVWPKLNTKMSLDAIRREYDAIKAFIGLPDSDAEDSEDDGSIDSDDDESESVEGSSEDEGSEEASDDADDEDDEDGASDDAESDDE